MQSDEKERIKELLKKRPDLICNALFNHSLKEAVAILKLPYWKDEKYSYLFTSSIWQSSANEIKKYYHLKSGMKKNFSIY